MRYSAWLIGTMIFTACSIDHVTVATLDDEAAGAPASDATTASAGLAATGLSAGAGGVASSGAVQPEGAAGRVLLDNGGSAGSIFLLGSAGDSGVSSVTRCSCLGEKPQFCGSDGLTYPMDCGDGGTCLPPSVECWHSCPCLVGEADAGVTSSFSADCAPPAQCNGDVVCMTFTNVSPNAQTTCTTN